MKPIMKTIPAKTASAVLAASLLLAPMAMAEDSIINLRPLNPDTGNTNYNYNDNYNNMNPNVNPAINVGQTQGQQALHGRVSSVPRGTMLMVKLDQPVSSFSSKLGDTVTATLENDIFINENIAIPAGSEVMGQVANADPAGHMGKHGQVDVRFNAIKTPDGNLIPIRAHIVTTDQTGILKGDTYTKDVVKDVGFSAGGAGVGTLMGLSAGSLVGAAGAGALLGLGVGAVGGMSYALIHKGKDVVIPMGSRMSIILDQEVSVSPQ